MEADKIIVENPAALGGQITTLYAPIAGRDVAGMVKLGSSEDGTNYLRSSNGEISLNTKRVEKFVDGVINPHVNTAQEAANEALDHLNDVKKYAVHRLVLEDGSLYDYKDDGTKRYIGYVKGPQGDRGLQGAQGLQGPPGEKGEQGPEGRPFKIIRTYPSVAVMHASHNRDLQYVGNFVIIQSDEADTDNAKLFLITETSYDFIADLSGFKGSPGDDGRDGEDAVVQSSFYLSGYEWDELSKQNRTYRFYLGHVSNPTLMDMRVTLVIKLEGYPYYFRFPCRIAYPYYRNSKPSSRITFCSERVMFDDESSKYLLPKFRLIEHTNTNAGSEFHTFYAEVTLYNNDLKIESCHLFLSNPVRFVDDFGPQHYDSGLSISESVTVYTADWANKNSVLNLDSRATAEGATVGGRGNRVEAEDAASFGNGGSITSAGKASLQAGTGNTNSGHDAIQGGKENTNSGPMSLQVGNDNDNTATDTMQAGCRNTNSAADTVQSGSDNTNTGSDTIQGGTSNTNSGTDCVQSGTGNTNKGNRVLQVGNGNYNEASDSLQSGIKNYNYGSDSVMFGHTQTNYGQHCHLHGYENHNDLINGARFDYVDMHGTRLKATRRLQMLRGQWSKDDARALAIWANGTSETDRKNVFSIAASGTPEVATDGVTVKYLADEIIKLKDELSQLLVQKETLAIGPPTQLESKQLSEAGYYYLFIKPNSRPNPVYSLGLVYWDGDTLTNTAASENSVSEVSAGDSNGYASYYACISGSGKISIMRYYKWTGTSGGHSTREDVTSEYVIYTKKIGQ